MWHNSNFKRLRLPSATGGGLKGEEEKKGGVCSCVRSFILIAGLRNCSAAPCHPSLRRRVRAVMEPSGDLNEFINWLNRTPIHGQ